MRRAVLSFAAAVILFSTVGVTAVAAQPTPPATAWATALPNAVVGVDDFVFESFTADYYLDVDEEGRSVLTTVETFVAAFPDFDQNRGMRRAIPGSYLGAPTDVTIVSVTDENGTPRPYEVETDDEGFVLVTSRASDFVYGKQTYVFTYTQRNVTRFFQNTNADEFFWDTNGTGWYQPFGTVTARVHVPAALAASLTGQNACYRGYEGSTEQCELTVEDGTDGTVIGASVSPIGPFENVSLAIGFQPQTFVPRDDSYLGSGLALGQLLALLASAVALIWAIALRLGPLADRRGRPTIIAEYTPPDDLDLITASVLLKRTQRAAASQFVDFAVTRRIRIIETETQGWFTKSKTYLLELLDASGLAGPPLTLAVALFGYQLEPGTGYLMSGKDVTLSQHVRSIIQTATSSANTAGLRRGPRVGLGLLVSVVAILAATAAFITGVAMLENATGGALPFLLFIPPIVVVLIVFGLVFRSSLTERGAELRDHLKGLELYIRLAEADRLEMLQSPTGAELESVSSIDPRQVVDVYEKLLPHAVLFGLERQWAIELGRYYAEASPDWYSGSGAFNAAVFASSISTMSSTAASSYSGSSSSSSSGGSGGGGSSGGGGGGGGGGGV